MGQTAGGKKQISNIWQVTREYNGLAGTREVKDLVKQLAETLSVSGEKISIVLPLYGFLNPEENGFNKSSLAFEVDMPYHVEERREKVEVWSQTLPNRNTIYLLDSPRFREKGWIYAYTAEEEKTNPQHGQGTGHIDFFAMNLLLQRATLNLIILLGEKPDIIHCHDAHTAILPAIAREVDGYRHYFRHTGMVLTIHNAGLAYQQDIGDLDFVHVLCGLPHRVIDESLLNSKFNPLLAASSYCVMNTVSGNYARELLETDDDVFAGGLGHRLVEKGVKLTGVTNGVNAADYDVSAQKKIGIAATFSLEKGEMEGKKKCKTHLLDLLANQKVEEVEQYGTLVPDPQLPLLTFIGSYSTQKGVDRLIEALTDMRREKEFQLVMLGRGTKEIETRLIATAEEEKNHGRMCVLCGYSSTLANQIFAAGDFFLVPSQYEPCGLKNLIAQLFGNLPVVHGVGGLANVVDGITGFSYQQNHVIALTEAIQRALRIFHEYPKKMLELQQQAFNNVKANHTWDMTLKDYIKLYHEAYAKAQKW
jgi:starch synthase